LISYHSDRLRTRWGRRIPIMLVATPVAAAGMIGVAFTPEVSHWLHAALGSGSPGLPWCVLLVISTFWAIFQLGFVTNAAIQPGLFNDVVPRPILGRVMALLRASSLIMGIAYNWFILGHVPAHFRLIYIGVAVVFFVGVMTMCLVVKEGQYPPPPLDNPDDLRARGIVAATKVYFRDCFSKPHYVWIFVALTMGALAVMAANTFGLRYALSLKMTAGEFGRWNGTNHLFGLMLAYPLGAMADRFHPARMTLIAISIYAVTLLLGALFIQGPFSFGMAHCAQGITSGIFWTCSASLPQRLLPRLKFAQYNSAAILMTAVGTIISGFGLGMLLDHTHSNYRLTYFCAAALAGIGAVAMFIVYRRFQAMGGQAGYVPPE
jgi:maltose/moltooligosaccharide transporter